MRIFFPQHNTSVLEDMRMQSPLSPFSPVVLAFVQQLSMSCVKQRHLPEVVALGYWLRKSNINQLQQQWIITNQGRHIKARGTIFHIAPSNVDTIFVYSWVLSLLAGNKNIVRLSTQVALEQHLLLSTIIEILKQPQFIELVNRNIFLTYEHDMAMTKKLSDYCHVRVIWGGDETIRKIRQVELPPLATELAFADRYSMSLIKAKAFIRLDEAEQYDLVTKFYNDAYWFNQLACSSPRLVVWDGEHQEVEASKALFWNLLERIIVEKNSTLNASVQIQKLATSMWLATESYVSSYRHEAEFSRVEVNDVNADVRERHCGGGLFVEYTISEQCELVKIIGDKDQTLTYFGYSRAELNNLDNQITSRGIDRIVPIGMALDFQAVWDGQEFIRSFTREVVIK